MNGSSSASSSLWIGFFCVVLITLSPPLAAAAEHRAGEEPAEGDEGTAKKGEAEGKQGMPGTGEPDLVQGLRVELNRVAFVPGDVVEITVVNERSESVFLPGCPPYRLERFVQDAFEIQAPSGCRSEGIATPVPPGGHSLSYHPKEGDAGSILRISVTFGEGCKENKPLSRANCSDFATLQSRSFRVGQSQE